MSVRRIDSDGDYVCGRRNAILPTGADATAQLIVCGFRLWKGEWFLDPTAGFAAIDREDGNQAVLGSRADKIFTEAELKRIALDTTGVIVVTRFDLQVDVTTRSVLAELDVETEYGSLPTIRTTFP